MKIWTSYFYKVRFFKPNQIPVSTAKTDPKWFHQFNGNKFRFFDKRGIINGLRCEDLHPNESCDGLCSGKPCRYSPDSCEFIRKYRSQIFGLNKETLMKRFDTLIEKLRPVIKTDEEFEIVLLVHEAVDNKCSERAVLQDFFGCKELQ